MDSLAVQRSSLGNLNQGLVGPRSTLKGRISPRLDPYSSPLIKNLPSAACRKPVTHQPLLPGNPIRCSLPPSTHKAHLAKRLTSSSSSQQKRATHHSARIRAEQGGSGAPQNDPPAAKAAFFDVDGTIAKTNIVWPYVYLRLRELSMLARVFWVPYFTTLSVLYRLADKIDRGLLCRFFYFNYRGRPAAAACEWGKFAYEEYMRPRLFRGAIQRIRDLKAAGFRVVLVTGSLSFMVAPLAAEIDADDVIAADLVERDGRFTGALAGAAFNGDDKAVIVKEYAAQHGVDLRRSHAYGDSIADLGMLESVGHPHAVLPDKRLRQIAELRGWPLVTEWAVEEKPPHPLTRLWV